MGLRPGSRSSALFALLIVGSVAAGVARAQPIPSDRVPARTFNLHALRVLAQLAGGEPQPPSPLAELFLREGQAAREGGSDGDGDGDGEEVQAALEALRAAGLVDDERRLTQGGAALWETLARPIVAWQVRAYARWSEQPSVRATWILASEARALQIAFDADLAVHVGEARPADRLLDLVASTIALPAPSASAGLDLTLDLADFLVLQTIARDGGLLAAAFGDSDAQPGLTADEVATYLLSPDRLAVLLDDPHFDVVAAWEGLSHAQALAARLDWLEAAGLVARSPSPHGPRYTLAGPGLALDAAILRPRALLTIARFAGGAGAPGSGASVEIGVAPGHVIAARHLAAPRRVALRSFPVGPTQGTLRALLADLAAPAALVAGAALAPVAPAGAASRAGASLADEVAAELARGADRRSAAYATADVWGRGRVDTWRVDPTGTGRAAIEYEDTSGDGAPDHVRVRSEPTGPFTHAFARREDGAWEQTNILAAFLEVEFRLPWARSAYEPHAVDVILNDRLVARLEAAVPEGRYRFRVRPRDLAVERASPRENTVRIESRHLRGGHYVVSTDYRLVVQMTEVSGYVIADSPEEARRLLAARGHLITHGVDLAVYANEWSIEPAVPSGGQEVRAIGVVHNDGEETARGWTLRVYEGAERREAAATIALAPIEKGSSLPVEVAWTLGGEARAVAIVVAPPEGTADLRPANDEVALPLGARR